VFSDIAYGVATTWANMQAGIAKKLLDWAGQEGFVGDQMRAFLGVDPRESTQRQRMTQQQRSGLSEQVRVWEDALTRVGGDGKVSGGVLAGTSATDLQARIADALAKMQMDAAGLSAEQLADGGVDEAKAIIDRENAARQQAIDESLGGILSSFDQWAGAADQRAADARQGIAGAAAAAEEARLTAQSNQYADDFAAAMQGESDTAAAAMVSDAGEVGIPSGLKAGGSSGTFSAAGAMALASGGGSPAERSAKASEKMLERFNTFLKKQEEQTKAIKEMGVFA
jgi:hypothetical protein